MIISKNTNGDYQIKLKETSAIFSPKDIEIEGLRFTGPGEYERKSIFVEGIKPDGEGTIFVVHAEDISLCHLAEISKPLSAEAVKSLGDVDILFISISDTNGMNPDQAEKTISTIDPRVVIIINSKDELIIEKASGRKPQFVENYKIKKAELPSEDRQVLVIN